jgi:hypothetical protein
LRTTQHFLHVNWAKCNNRGQLVENKSRINPKSASNF